MNPPPSTWEITADDVLSVLLNDAAARDEALYTLGLTDGGMPTREHKLVFNAIADLHREQSPIHDTLIWDRCHEGVQLNWLIQRNALFDALRTGSVFTENVKLLQRHGERRSKLIAVQQAVAALSNGGDTSETVNLLMSQLATGGQTVIRGETAGEHGQEFADFMESEPTPAISTGIPWIDNLTGGIISGRIWWIGGPYKSRKTTLALNMLLSYCMVNPTLGGAVLSKEVYTRDINAQLCAMLATGYMRRYGWYSPTDNLLSADNLILAKRRYHTWGTQKEQAVRWAIDQYKKLQNRLRVYDSTPEKGGLHDFDSIQRVIRRDASLYNGSLYFVDYLQLFAGKGDGIYERVSYLARELQELTGRLNITLVVIAQLNEETVKGDGEGYSPGVKGGGDPAQTANYFLTTQYKKGDLAEDDTKLSVQMKLSRHGQGGAGVKTPMEIHPGSGLLLDSNWIKGRS